VHSMTFARRNRLTTHFSERIPVVKRRISVVVWIPTCIMLLINVRSLYFEAVQLPGYVKGGASPKWTKLFHEYPIGNNTCPIR